MFYVKALNKCVHVHLDLVAMHVDSSEFCDIKHLACGNSKYTSTRGWFLNTGEVWSKVPSCGQCYKRMLQNEHSWKVNVYENCVNWDIWKDPLGLLQYNPLEHYLSSMIHNKSTGKLLLLTQGIKAC
eukprot:8521783-Ditylum_brightwellii.AAC.1